MTSLYLSYLGFVDKVQQLQNSQRVEGFTHISKVLTGLAFELQNERGLSLGFLMSKDPRFSQELHRQRTQTDASYGQFRDTLEELGPANKYWGLKKEFAQFSDSFGQLSIIRESIDKRQASDVFTYFSELNSQSVNLMQHLKRLVNDSLLVGLYDTSLLLFWLQERTAQERGVLTGVFASGKLDAESFQRFSFYKLDQERLFEEFYSVASKQQQALLKQQLSHFFVDKVAEVQQVIFNKAVKNDLLNELQRLLGFGGLIHDFKNYIIRDKGQYYLYQFKDKASQVQEIIYQYRNISGLTPKEHVDLTILEQSFNRYAENIRVAERMKKDGVSARIINQLKFRSSK